MHFVLALCLFARESYEEVLRVLTSGIPGRRALARVIRSSLCRARARLGEDVPETVFRQVAGRRTAPPSGDGRAPASEAGEVLLAQFLPHHGDPGRGHHRLQR